MEGDNLISNSDLYNIRIAGNEVTNGNMLIEDYTQYLQNINQLCQSANSILNPGYELNIQVNSNIEHGSMINLVRFIVKGVGLFTGASVPYTSEDILALLGLLEENGKGLIQLLLSKGDSEIESIMDIDGERVKVQFKGKNAGKEYVETTKEVLNLYKDKNVRDNLEKTTDILSKEGYDKIGFKRDRDKKYNYIDKGNIIHLKSDDDVEIQLNTKIYTTIVDIEYITLTNLNNKWKFKENNTPSYWAYVKDEKFKEDIKKNGIKPPFSLKVQIKQTDTYSDNRIIQVEKEIIKVEQTY